MSCLTQLCVLFQQQDHLYKLRALCVPAEAAAAIASDPSCSSLQGVCVHYFESSVIGVAGSFTGLQLQHLQDCLPGAVDYVERDGQVCLVCIPFHRPHDTLQAVINGLPYLDHSNAADKLLLTAATLFTAAAS